MKVKRLFSVLGLGLFAFASAGVGALSLKKSESNEVKADAGDTWMTMCTIDMKNIITSNDGTVSNIRWHVWGSGVDETFAMHESGCENNFTVMASFTDSESISGCQFIFDQTGGTYPGTKYSTDSSISISKNSTEFDVRYVSLSTWSGDKWEISAPGKYTAFSWFGGSSKTYSRDPVNKVLSVKNIEVNNPSFYVESRVIHGSISDYTGGIVRTSSADYVKASSVSWIELVPGYTYDFFVYNDYTNGGIFEIKAHNDEETYIYYVLENGTPTNDYIYSWGAANQFGSWPGTKVTSVPGVQEVTNNGILHFQGGEVGKLIYKIPVTIGYPSGDESFLFNNNDDWQSEDRQLCRHNAYWYTGSPNSQAGYAIDFLVAAEAVRNSADDTSVCNISIEDAKSIVNEYNTLGTAMWEDYIDCTTVWTHKRDGSDGNELVSYRAIIEQLGKIADVSPAGASRFVPINNNSNVNSSTVIIVIAVSLSLVGFTTLIVIRRRKHQ